VGYKNGPGETNGTGVPRVGPGEAVFRGALVGGSFTTAMHGGGQDLAGRPFVNPDGSPNAGWWKAAPYCFFPYYNGSNGINASWEGSHSFHTGGVQVTMADGSVRFVSQNVDWLLWNSLNSRNNGEIVGEF
jgi:prepilin-type processing-associated H-X9-DG protein